MSKKYRLPRKILSKSEALDKRDQILMQIENMLEENLYWKVRLNKPLDSIDIFIIMPDKTVNSPEEIIERNNEKIDHHTFVIDNYLNKFIYPQ